MWWWGSLYEAIKPSLKIGSATPWTMLIDWIKENGENRDERWYLLFSVYPAGQIRWVSASILTTINFVMLSQHDELHPLNPQVKTKPLSHQIIFVKKTICHFAHKSFNVILQKLLWPKHGDIGRKACCHYNFYCKKKCIKN